MNFSAKIMFFTIVHPLFQKNIVILKPEILPTDNDITHNL